MRVCPVKRVRESEKMAGEQLITPVGVLTFSRVAVRGKSRAEAKNGDCHQFAPRHGPRNKALSLKRIGWLYPIFRDLHFYHGLGARLIAPGKDQGP